jgi:GNAT superfamily N-acetyltransferase
MMPEVDRPVSIRQAIPADAAALAGIFEASWRQAYTGIIPYERLAETIKRHGERWWWRTLSRGGGHLLLEVMGEPAGYATFGRSRHSGRQEGEIYELYLAPLYQGLGFGEHLFEACRTCLDECGLRGLIVWVLRENRAARSFYACRGGVAKLRRIDLSTGAPLEKLGYVWD